ncbi:site-specific integrase [Vreelandella titanicae]|uniref:site-specific integrase n=1 Tax=Vreelandella titanicae TaxID=664683 RepID=UPI0039BF2DDB
MSKHVPSWDSVNTPSNVDEQVALVQEFHSYLVRRGYADRTLYLYCSVATHFLRWQHEAGSARHCIDAPSVSRFLFEHVPACCCPHSGSMDFKSMRAALNQLLLMRGENRLRPSIPLASPSIETTVTRFDSYLEQVCGLTAATRWYHRRYARAFLLELCGGTPVDLSRITADALLQFVNDQARRLLPASVGVLAYSLRTFLRFLQLQGHDSTNLIPAVPRSATWSLASLPPSLSAAELKRFWHAFDRHTPAGRRDYAMARCLADLGLRCQEIANLSLDDIDWRSATICLPGNKSRRERQLPLPQLTGGALADYLRHGRPVIPTRTVFVLHRAPVGQAATNTTVRGAIRRAFVRAGLPWSGTHILRHTVAARMVQGGVPLKEVADVLGHRNIDTTLIYTKVNLPHLAHVALPWPGRQP